MSNKVAAYRRLFEGKSPAMPQWKMWMLGKVGIKITTPIDELSEDARIVLADLNKFCGGNGGETAHPDVGATYLSLGKREVIDRIYGFLNYNPQHAMRLREHHQSMELRDYEDE